MSSSRTLCWKWHDCKSNLDPIDLNEVVKMIKHEEISSISSKIIHAQTKTMFLASNMHMMMQTLEEINGPCLPHGLSIIIPIPRWPQGASELQSLWRIWPLLQSPLLGSQDCLGCGCNAIPWVEISAGLLERLDKMQGIQMSKMSVEQRKETLFQQLDLSGLEGWSPQNQAATHTLLPEYHDIFSLELGELGCTDLVNHKIKVTDYEPFKDRFQRIPPTMVDEVHSHMEEMMEVGAICPS